MSGRVVVCVNREEEPVFPRRCGRVFTPGANAGAVYAGQGKEERRLRIAALVRCLYGPGTNSFPPMGVDSRLRCPTSELRPWGSPIGEGAGLEADCRRRTSGGRYARHGR